MKKVIYLFISLISLIECLNWKLEPTCEIPPARGGHRLVNVDDELIVLWGGFFECFEPVTQNCDNQYRDDLWHYDLDKDKWISVNVTTDKPEPRTFFGANLWKRDESIVVVFAGARYNSTFTSYVNFGDIWYYNPYQKTWTLINATNDGPGPRTGPSVAIYKDDMYVFGGVAGTSTSALQIKGDLWKFNLITKNWTLLIPEGQPGNPQPTYLGSFRLDKERKQMVLYSGAIIRAGAGILTNETWLYSIRHNDWRKVGNVIPSRVHNSAEVIDDQFVVAFGDMQVTVNGTDQCITSTISSGHKPTKEVWALNLNSLRWKQLDVKCSEKKKRTASTRVRGRIFDWGGFNYECPFGAPGYPLWDRQLRSLKIED